MKVSRRDFIKYCLGSAATIGLSLDVVGRLQQALAGDATMPTVVWLNGANCTGCTVSLANLVGSGAPTDVADLLINHINLAFHPNLMGAAGDLAVSQLQNALSGDFVLVVDGGIPTAFDGHTCMLWTEHTNSGGLREVTALQALQEYAPKAICVLAVGTCASYGGVAGGTPNPTAIKGVSEIIGSQAINIPGCPPHPDWMVWTIAQLLAGVVPQLDGNGRPRDLFNEKNSVHKRCPRKDGAGEAKIFGVDGQCMKEIGCQGPKSMADCSTRQWNNQTNWCVGANTVCLACTESGFPDKFSPFFKYHDIKVSEEPGGSSGDSSGGSTGSSEGSGEHKEEKEKKKEKDKKKKKEKKKKDKRQAA